MLLLGEMLPARAAAEYGLVNRVVTADKLLDETLGLARLIASKPATTLAIGKEAFYRQIEMPLAEAYDYAAGVMVTNMLHGEAKEGIGAFIDKRLPDWTKG
jgi:enoyl-CoA hydratase/carnithine racemase